MPNQYTDPNAEPVLPPDYQAFATSTGFVVRDNLAGQDYPFELKNSLDAAAKLIAGNVRLARLGLVGSPSDINAYEVPTSAPDLFAV
jgi:hypothetical protein